MYFVFSIKLKLKKPLPIIFKDKSLHLIHYRANKIVHQMSREQAKAKQSVRVFR